ncbi:hypothetical protein L2E82_30167 [Cichorium intybus]|uniref:Uncharacterized protein n=1 Tax=Cichorium intybus TaxID=13427 RepID=A0ACB9CZS2_CICIN|nr:hypothetical protein L2E82_30167 [Cichorium intybus]
MWDPPPDLKAVKISSPISIIEHWFRTSDDIYEKMDIRERVDYRDRNILKPNLLEHATQRAETSDFAHRNMKCPPLMDNLEAETYETHEKDSVGSF